MRKPLPSVSELIDALGGNPVVAAACGVGPSAVSNWRAWNRFPERSSLHRMLERLCKERGVRVPKDYFDRMSRSPDGAVA